MNFQINLLLRRKGQGENGQNVGPVMFLATIYGKEWGSDYHIVHWLVIL